MLQIFALKLPISKIHPQLMIAMGLLLRSWSGVLQFLLTCYPEKKSVSVYIA